jgi:uncharacterized alpha/beta hydrolase family protein
LEDSGVDMRIILKRILKKVYERIWTDVISFKMGGGGGERRLVNATVQLQFPTVRGIFGIAEELSVS